MLGRLAAALMAATIVLAGVTRPAWSDCRIAMPRADLPSAIVRVGGRSWDVHIEGAVATLTAVPGAAAVKVDVEQPLRFRASVDVAAVRLEPKRPVDLLDGRIRIGQQAIGRWTAAPGGVQPALRDTLDLSSDPPVVVPCADVQAVPAEDGELRPSISLIARKTGPLGSLGPRAIELFAAPERLAPIRIRFAGQIGVLARKGPWAQIQADFDDGSRIQGWVDARDVDPRPGPAGGRGFSSSGATAERCTDQPIRTAVTIQAGAPVANKPDGSAWAHTTRPITAQAVDSSLQSGSAWVQLAGLESLPATSCGLQFAWVRRADLISAVDRGAAAKPGPRR